MRSFDLVDYKILEAHYFLSKMTGCVSFPEIEFIFSAFISAARSITFCLQSVLKDLDGFEIWYSHQQQLLKKNSLARFFIEARNLSQKVGVVPISGGKTDQDDQGNITMVHFFERSHPDYCNLPTTNVYDSCKSYFMTLLDIVLKCYESFGIYVDPHQYYTKANFCRIGKTIDDADEEIIGARGWTYVDGLPEAYRWQMLRNSVQGSSLSEIFLKFLNKKKPHPSLLPENPDDYNGKEWVPPCLRQRNYK